MEWDTQRWRKVAVVAKEDNIHDEVRTVVVVVVGKHEGVESRDSGQPESW